MAKIKSMSVKDFMQGKEWSSTKLNKKNLVLSGIASGTMASGIVAMSNILPQGSTQAVSVMAVPASVSIPQPIMGGILAGASVAKITTAFTPLLQLLQELAFPVTSIIITGACFLYMLNMKDKATTLMTNGIVGFFLIHLAPVFMKVLAEIAKAM